jgi:integrase/recombinase XerD
LLKKGRPPETIRVRYENLEDAMGQLRDRMEADLKLAGYSASTSKIYLLYARLYAKYHMRPPAEMGEDEIREFLLHCIEEREASRSTIRQARAALTFLYATTLKQPTEVAHLPVMRREHRLPVVLSGSEVARTLAAVESMKYRTVLMALYAGGLRISEGRRLRPTDIDSKRMLVHVRAGKGGRDRYTILSQRLVEQLRDYYRQERPETWLFPGGTKAGTVSDNTVRRAFQQALAAAGIKKDATPHTLRRSFATHLLESGVDITVIRALLGHGSLRATECYTRVSLAHLGRVRSPLDVLGTSDGAVLG